MSARTACGRSRDECRPERAIRTAPTVVDRLLVGLLRLTALPERARQRRRLRVLAADPAFLKDAGISRSDALREAAKPAWRA